jgi:undecaprenyl-diphosphatase
MTTIFEFDKFIFTWINTDWSNPIFDLMMPILSHLADRNITWLWIIFIGFISAMHFARSDKTKESKFKRLPIIRAFVFFCLFSAMIYGVNAGAYVGLKRSSNRSRPFVEQNAILRVSPATILKLQEDGSFPSGHACNAFMIAALFAERVRRKRIFFYGLASLIALSRIYLGVHYPSDVMIGSRLGLTVTWLMLSFQALRNRITSEHYFLL